MINNIVTTIISVSLLLQSSIYGEEVGFISNNIIHVSSSNDTISILTGKYDQISNSNVLSISHITSIDSAVISSYSNWKLFTLDKIQSLYTEIAFGNNLTVVCLDSVKYHEPNKIRIVDHNKNSVADSSFSWNMTLKADTSKSLQAVRVAFCKDDFFFACNDGGLVKWDLKNNSKSVFIPGNKIPVQIEKFTGLSENHDTMKRVIEIEACKNFLMITTPDTAWNFSIVDSAWIGYGRVSLDSNIVIKEFQHVFADENSPDHPMYSIAKISKGGSDTTVLCKYSSKEGGWKVLLNEEIDGICFGVKGYIYTFSRKDSTEIKVYHDTLGDSGVPYNIHPENSYNVDSRLIKGHETAPNINFVKFTSKTDSTGILWVATSSGLFMSSNEIPGISKDPLICIKRVTPVKTSLKQAFASPGILKYNGEVRFVYNLAKDAKVTIRVFDYNMDLVKTVIDNQLRPAGDHGPESGRSNYKEVDKWNGINKNGQNVAPGVYYFKITSDNGDRAFGKIVVAR